MSHSNLVRFDLDVYDSWRPPILYCASVKLPPTPLRQAKQSTYESQTICIVFVTSAWLRETSGNRGTI